MEKIVVPRKDEILDCLRRVAQSLRTAKLEPSFLSTKQVTRDIEEANQIILRCGRKSGDAVAVSLEK